MEQKLKKVILFSNGMVMAFDENGEQIPELQGRHNAVKVSLEKMNLEDVSFEIGSWGNATTLPMTPNQFFSEGWD